MADLQIISQLTRKRDEIEARIEAYEKALADCRADLVAVTSTMMIYQNEGQIRPATSLGRLFKRGEVFRLALEALEAAGKPLDTRELAAAIAEAKGLDAGDKVLRKAIAYNIVCTLTMRAKRGQIVKGGKRRGVVVWAAG